MSTTPAEPDVHYICQRCTKCCRWPGTVALAEGETERIAEFLRLSIDAFIAQYTELLPSRAGLGIVSRADHTCSMLDGRDCRINPVKPRQCAGFPNTWNFPGWRDVCEAIPVPRGPRENALPLS